MKKSKKSFELASLYPFFFTIAFVVVLFQYSFSSLEAVFYDLRVRFDLGTSFKDNIVLITLDEESDEFLGENYPYTFATHRRMLEKLKQDQPKIINFMVNFQEPESLVDKENLLTFKKELVDFKSKGGGVRLAYEMDAWGELLPPNDLRDIGYSLALINIDNSTFAKDDIVRRAILTISGENSLHLWTANFDRKISGLDELSAKRIKGAYYNREADANFALFRYYTSPLDSNGRIKKIPFHRVAVGNFPRGFFTDKIVLIGSSYISNPSDYLLTPFNKEEYKSSKLSIHASIIQSLLQEKTVYALPRTFSYGVSIFLAMILSIFISRLRPTMGLFLTVILVFLVIVSSYLLFSIFGIWIYISHMILTIFVVYYIWVPFKAIGEYQKRYAIQEEAKLIKKVENLKQNFISLMSHDLKTPVAKISGLVDMIGRQKDLSSESKKQLELINDSTKELNGFITSILDLTKIESSNLTLNLITKDINPLIESIVQGLRYEAGLKNVKIELDLQPLYPITFDMTLIKRVISNLVENALKYSGNDTVVSVSTKDEGEWVFIDVADNGVGIGGDDLAHIFDKFYRVKNDASHSIKGTGLGLYLVKYFVELHGGTIGVESTMGQGTKFTVKLRNA
ncbi:MAG: hypothetical protein COW00_05495 [Bdellovibrio sp. CG12_big_fil_rev_8_21_14_0_65_39_13]|nr:MAG: hypothetical protein COW78_18030 [Bdellovibrio sp. CG22_combo_CG10-13_8_21_14_all_39_27]PIQ60686.1 MAG: hypothetical protein COW00_05495 [Bdellovibrio sp. CG12_big_fil_rev_8_21_14_0_65_39_13]PIR37070.1 MAG: hypothetical protein COV37_00855 [Bdellovibrio sp. CG11_big_fil_rev_8_21_14_0_20_39_38]